MMAEVDSRYEISDAITSLGKLLRYSMRRTSDNVPLGEESETGGIGLKNVHDRIVMAFGPEYGINAASDTAAGRTTITIRAP